MPRFFIEGIEVNLDDPNFYLPIEKVNKIIKILTEYKDDNECKMAQEE